MNSATVMSLSDIFMFCNSVGIVLPFQEPCYGVKKPHGRILAKRRDYGKHEHNFLDFLPPISCLWRRDVVSFQRFRFWKQVIFDIVLRSRTRG